MESRDKGGQCWTWGTKDALRTKGDYDRERGGWAPFPTCMENKGATMPQPGEKGHSGGYGTKARVLVLATVRNGDTGKSNRVSSATGGSTQAH